MSSPRQETDNVVREPRHVVVFAGEGIDQNISRLVSQIDAPRLCCVDDGRLSVLPGLTSRFKVAGYYAGEAVPLIRFAPAVLADIDERESQLCSGVSLHRPPTLGRCTWKVLSEKAATESEHFPENFGGHA